MKSHAEKVSDLASGKPIGSVTPIGKNGYGKDESGRIFKIESIDQIERRKREAAKKRDQRHFSFSHMRHIREITDNLSNKQCGYILILQPYIQFKTNILIDSSGKPLIEKEIAKALKVTVKTVKSVIEQLKNDDVISVDKDGYFRINERYHFRKKAGDDESMLIKTFFATLKELKLKPAELGVLYKLLPYVHYETNMICANPFEEVPANIRFLSTKQISKLIGLHEKKAIEVLRELKKANTIAETSKYDGDARVKYITLNPFIFSRIAGKPDATLAAMFLSHQYQEEKL